MGEAFSKLNWKIGGWHYCGGVIKIRRAELATNPAERKENFEHAISDAKYSYSKIDKTHPWAAEMAITIARGYRGLGEIVKAKQYLNEALQYHPDYVGAYLVYALLYIDEDDYQSAKDWLLKGDKAVAGKSPVINYYLALMSYDLGEIDEAKHYAEIAEEQGHPLMGLKKKLYPAGRPEPAER